MPTAARMNPQVVVIGEALCDVLVGGGQEQRRAGGGPANTAAALGRLGVDVSLLTELGPDPDGDLVRAHLRGSHVQLLELPATRTAVASAHLDAHGQATYDIDLHWSLAGSPGLPPSDVVHVASLGALLEPGAARARDLVAGSPAWLSYDPNCRPRATPDRDRVRTAVEAWVRRSALVKLSEEDAAWLYPGEPHEAVAGRLRQLGAAVVVLTHGPAGATAWTSSERVEVPAASGGPVVDTVGAGDSFTAGLLHHLVSGGHHPARLAGAVLRAALEHAALVARRTCERPGADPPWLADLV